MISGYCWPQSARAGETVTLFVSTDGARFDVRVVRQGAKDEQVLHREGLAGVRHEIPIDVSTAGCGWPGAEAVGPHPNMHQSQTILYSA